LLHEALDVGVAQLGLGLPFELGFGQPDGDDGGEAFSDVVAGQTALESLEESLRLGVAGKSARAGRPEATEVGSPLARVDVVGEREDRFLIAIVVLQGDLDLDVTLLALEVEHPGVDGRFVLVEVLDELDDAPTIEERVAPLVALVRDDDLQAFVEEGQLTQTVT